MIPLVALVTREELPPKVILLLLFALFYVVRWILTQLGILKEKGEASTVESQRERMRQLREERRQAEADGEDLWRRLADGDESARPTPVPAPAASTATVPPPVPSVREASLETESLESESLEQEVEPLPLGVLGEVSEPADVASVSLETEVEPEPLAMLEAGAPPEAAVAARARRFTPFDGRRAIVYAEVLGPPLAMRS